LSDTIFVFGSNLAGRHGRGAAKYAREVYYAEYGVGSGRTGMSYAIPTKDNRIKTLPLSDIEPHVKQFICYAIEHPDLCFELTKIGCGLAGYSEEEISPMFKGCPTNVDMPTGWRI